MIQRKFSNRCLSRCAGLALAIAGLFIFSAAAEDTKTNRIALNLEFRGQTIVTGIVELPQVAKTNTLTLSVWPEGALQLQKQAVIVPPNSSQRFNGEVKAKRYREITVTAQNDEIRLQTIVEIIPARWTITGLALIGAGVVVLLLIVLPVLAGGGWGGVGFLVIGEDGLPSTSKCQATLWTAAVFFAYPTIGLVKWLETGSFFMDVPEGLAVAMGVSLATAVAAKAITQRQVEEGKITKLEAGKASNTSWSLRYLFMTDGGRLDLGKVQLMGWTIIGLTIFALEWVRVITLGDARAMKLPDLDPALWVLMGLANGGYLGGKLVRIGGFEILHFDPVTVNASSPVPTTAVCNLMIAQNSKITVLIDDKADPDWKAVRKDEHVVSIAVPAGQTPRTVHVGLEIDGLKSSKPVILKIT